jgi:hypothetical protein
MAVPWVGIAGAIVTAVGQVGGLTQSGPGALNFDVPDENPIAKQIAKYQLQIAREMAGKMDDPRTKEAIYKLLPEADMSETDRSRFTEEYTDIKKEVAATGMQQVNQAVGRDLDELVRKGVISSEQAERQRMKNDANVSAVLSVINKRLDASRIRMARQEYIKKGMSGIEGASALAEVDESYRRAFNAAVGSGLDFGLRRAAQGQSLLTRAALQQEDTSLSEFATRKSFSMGSLLAAAETGSSIYSSRQAANERAKTLDYLKSYIESDRNYNRSSGPYSTLQGRRS